MNNKVVLAFSGGLDTSFCIPYLKNEKGLEVHTVTVNTGGFSENDVKAIEKKALALGAASHVTVDASHTYYRKGLKYLIYGNVLKNATYPLSVSSERVFQALEVYRHVKATGASYVAHGSTGAGNDQVRFDIVFEILAPEIQIIAPVRELALTRQEEIAYLNSHGFHFSWEKAKYSINQGLWGTSIGGVETLSSGSWFPEEAYPIQVTRHGTEHLRIGFEKGEPASLNGTAMDPVELIRELHAIAAPYGIGRDIHVGDTIIGIKGRVAFEAAAPLILIKAHHLLEKHVLTKGQLERPDSLLVRPTDARGHVSGSGDEGHGSDDGQYGAVRHGRGGSGAQALQLLGAWMQQRTRPDEFQIRHLRRNQPLLYRCRRYRIHQSAGQPAEDILWCKRERCRKSH